MIEVRTPCRLHFGLLAYSSGQSRQYGGVGVMIKRPDIALRVTSADTFTSEGPLADRAAEYARRFAARCGRPVAGAHIRVLRAPRPHTGLGTGTQLGIAVAKALSQMIGCDNGGPATLAGLVGRGHRSAIGTHGFFTGGFIVEGGKVESENLSPLVVQQAFPSNWRIVLVCPNHLAGLTGDREIKAFASMSSISDEATSRMCRLVLLALTPALLEQDLEGFGQALYELQQVAGSCFKQAQGGVYADRLLEQVVHFIRGHGVCGVGQSSWGPSLYAVVGDEDHATELAGRIQKKFEFSPGEVMVTSADNRGATVQPSAMPAGSLS